MNRTHVSCENEGRERRKQGSGMKDGVERSRGMESRSDHASC